MANKNDGDGGDDGSNDEPQEIGYGKPPKHTRFKKGQSGNKKGRPKGSLNFDTYIDQELNKTVLVTDNGVRRRISKKQAVAKQIVNKAASGDPKAIPLLLKRDRDNQVSGEVQGTPSLKAEDLLVIESIVRRIRESTDASDPKHTAGQIPPKGRDSEPDAKDGA